MNDYRVGRVAEIPVGEGRAYAVAGDQVAVFRLRNGALRAVSAVCPHRGGPLADGLADERLVVCPLHGNAYALADGCSATGQAPLLVYDVTVVDGDLLVSVPGRSACTTGRAEADAGRRLPEAGAGRAGDDPVRPPGSETSSVSARG